jgi:hypothetical protein
MLGNCRSTLSSVFHMERGWYLGFAEAMRVMRLAD